MAVELRHLRYFSAVAETLNFRAASARLNVSAPALSKQVRHLEEELGVRLFDRDTTQVRLTNAGAVFLGEVRSILSHADRAIAQTREAARGRRGRLIVGNVGPLTAGYMADCVTAFCARYPDVELELVDIGPLHQLTALEEHEIQVGFVPAGTLRYLGPDVRHVAVLSTPLYIILRDEHRLAAQRAISFADLAGEKLLFISSDSPVLSHRRFVLERFAARGLTPRQVRDVKGVESLLAMVASGLGVSIIAGRPASMRMERLVSRPLKDGGDDTKIEMHAIWLPGSAEALATNFIDEFRRLTRTMKTPLEDRDAPRTPKRRRP